MTSHVMRLRFGFALVLLVLCLGCTAGTDAEPSPVFYAQEFETPELELITILGREAPGRPVHPAGRFRVGRPHAGGERGATKTAKEERLLEALPYVSGSQIATDHVGVTRHNRNRAYAGLNILTSGHAPAAFVMNMEGEVLHEWHFDLEKVWTDVPDAMNGKFWRKIHAYPNGDLLALFEGIGLIKIDRHSRLLWAHRDGFHHQAFVAEDGTIHVLNRRPEVVESDESQRVFLHESIAVLAPDGRRLNEVSILESFQNSRYRHLLERADRTVDMLHTNSIFVFDRSREEAFEHYRKGNVLISILKLDTIAIIDPEARQVVWAAAGGGDDSWLRQHDPTLLPSGEILLFDNRGRSGRSRVLVYDPVSEFSSWSYPAAEGEDLFSRTCGTARYLPNGNILITESDNGRVLEVTPNREIMWEFYNPHRAGEDGKLVATVFELQRVNPNYFPWLD